MPRQTATTKHQALVDTTTLVARAAIGIIFVAHGWQKLADTDGTTQMFAGLGIPLPEIATIVAIVIELGGGIALVIGFALPVTGVLLAAMMASAYVFSHTGDPLVDGFELPLALGTSALALGFAGGGFAVDRLLPWGRRGANEDVTRHTPASV